MEKEIYGYIYKITNTVNGKIYIGLTTNGFDRRYSAYGEGIEKVYNYHTSRKRREEFYNAHLLNSIEKYGFKAFEVIKEFDVAYSEEELKEKERYWISYYKCNDRNYGYNSTEGGDTGSGLSGKDSPRYKGFVVIHPDGKVSEEMTRDEVEGCLGVGQGIITDLAKEKTCYIGYYKHIRHVRVLHLEDYLKEREIYKSDEDFVNMCKQMVEEAEILYEEKEEEYRKKLSEANKGENNHFYGRQLSEEHRKKIGEARRGKYIGENHPMYGNGDKLKGKKNGRAKLVVCVFPDGRIIKDVCMKELAKELNVDIQLVRKILNSKQPYKAPSKCNNFISKEKFEYLKTLEGIRIMYYEDYLK